ncbi:tRNA (adenine(22)-N(1))-methyltransferase TrmK [Salipaludibacillus neizhouensis]|uniref:tRNA (Adenine(22)-N(1))-methyltransferase TrmK n=1 Tax=Salipaludibacillus neizhouensis TaxID=885475 RepID=A0A3A9KDR1_9BACI|nr:tRNA (adenine(22)-N(1))-methyltransferase TrmK [Salipaludibacillus neizhouensis]RKL68692.1 tRNA (adenine(22)-N(1))-methyltransferase TrmK [Salipaludibacillus neizhouensis]
MNEQNLSIRLHTVGGYVIGDTVADIGTDHAYLPVFLVQNKKCKTAIAGEVNEGPLSSARSLINKHELSSKITAKLGSGLEVLEGENVDTIVIAGMGGPLITSILDEGKQQLVNVKRLVLQPNVAANHIRKWLFQHQWSLIAEEMVEEDEHIYEIIVAEPGKPSAMYSDNLEKELWMGPCLLKNKNSTFQKKWIREELKLEHVRSQIQQAKKETNKEEKMNEISKRLQWIKEELS